MSTPDREHKFAAFISYSHRADSRAASVLQHSLQRFGAPFLRARSMRVFRDESNLPMTDDAWREIAGALDDSGFFLLLASPESARSRWVARELAYFFETQGSRQFGIAVTRGTTPWTDSTLPTDERSAISPELFRLCTASGSEPLVVNLRPYRSKLGGLRKKRGYYQDIAAIVSGMTGTPKDDLFGQHLVALRWRFAFLALLVSLLVTAALVAGYYFREKEAERLRAERSEAAENARSAEVQWRLADQVRVDTGTQSPNPITAARHLLRAASFAERAGDHDQARQAIAGATNELRWLRWTARLGAAVRGIERHPEKPRLLVHAEEKGFCELSLSDGSSQRPWVGGSPLRWARYFWEGRRVLALVVHDESSQLEVWDAETWKRIAKVPANESELRRIGFAMRGPAFVLPVPGGYELRSAVDGSRVRRTLASDDNAVDLTQREPRFSADGRFVGWVQFGGFHLLGLGGEAWDSPPSNKVLTFAFSTDSRHVLLFEARGLRRVRVDSGSTEWFKPLAIRGAVAAEDGRRVLVSRGRMGRIYDADSAAIHSEFRVDSDRSLGRKLDTFDQFRVGSQRSVIWQGDGNVVILDATGHRIWSTNSSTNEYVLDTDLELGVVLSRSQAADAVVATVLDPEGFQARIRYAQDVHKAQALSRKEVLVTSLTGGVRVFSLSPDGAVPSASTFTHEARLSGAQLLRDYDRLVTWDMAGALRLWTFSDPRQKRVGVPANVAPDKHVFSLSGEATRRSPDGAWRVRVEDAENFVLEKSDGSRIPVKGNRPIDAVFSPDSRNFVWSDELNAHAIDLQARRRYPTVIEHSEGTTDMFFSPDGKLLATVSLDNTVRVWAAEQGFVMVASLFHDEDVRKGWFSNDGRYLVSVDNAGVARVWTTVNFSRVMQADVGPYESARFDADRARIHQVATGESWRVEPASIQSLDAALKDFETRTASEP